MVPARMTGHTPVVDPSVIEQPAGRQQAFSRFMTALDAREDEVGAFVCLDQEAAARASAAATGPLRGLPVGIKDIIETADFPTQCGSAIYRGRQVPADAPIVSMIRRAGGVILGKTTTTEFAHATPTATRNPHHLGHTPGGSSAGSAAAVAAGFVPFAVGTQTGGSVIRPAAFCGVAGYKPTFDLLPTAGAKTLSWTLDTLGLFAPTVADVAFFAQAITGRTLAVDYPPDWHPRVGVVEMTAIGDASDQIRGAVASCADAAARRGATLTPVRLGAVFDQAQDAQVVVQEYEASRALAWEYDTHRDLLSPALAAALEAAWTIPIDHYLAALEARRKASVALAEVFAQVDVLLLPSAPGAAPAGLSSTGSAIFNRLWSLLGCPAVNVPRYRDSAGLPLGVQVVGPVGADHLVLNVAAYLEAS
jgi:Asp-tRNA(Asn)/Glu-tRNA(Gln) amidotransferase A subunit family amidase